MTHLNFATIREHLKTCDRSVHPCGPLMHEVERLREALEKRPSVETPDALTQPTTYAGLSERVEDEIERAYWVMLAHQDRTQTELVKSERDAFKAAVREMFRRLRQL